MIALPWDTPPEHNPFSTRHVRPGALPFLFGDGTTMPVLVERLAAHDWQGQIIGPHGSGKSTLLKSLMPALKAAGRHVLRTALRDGQRRLAFDFRRALAVAAEQGRRPFVIVVDGFEQLGCLSRWLLRRRCRKSGWGLLVTAHADIGLPTLFETRVTPAIAAAVVDRLLRSSGGRASDEELAQALVRHGGNLRDVLFELYDDFERRRR